MTVVKNIFEKFKIYERELNLAKARIVSDSELLVDFVKFMSFNNNLSLDNNFVIFDKHPNYKLCMKFDEWKSLYGKIPAYGSKGTQIFTSTSNSLISDHVFDLSQTIQKIPVEKEFEFDYLTQEEFSSFLKNNQKQEIYR